MEVLNQIAESLTKEEVRNLKLYYPQLPAGEARKDLVLFDYVRSSGQRFKEEKALKKLDYHDKNRSSYYHLKSRLIEGVGDSLVLLHAHKNELYELLQFIQLFHIYSARNLYKTCLFYLRKAERLALAIENYELLDIIYALTIRLAADLIEIDPLGYIEKREKNAVIIAQLREMDDLLARLNYGLKVGQNFAAQDKKLLNTLQQKVNDISKHTTAGLSKNLEVKVYHALSQIFLQQHDYTSLEKLVKETYARFEKEKRFDRNNHQLKLQMLTYLVNTLYKNRKYKESLQYGEVLGTEINSFEKLHYDKYLFFYYNSKVLNYAALEPPKALKALDELEQIMRQKKSTYYDFFIFLNRATILYDLGRYKESLKNLVRLYVSDGYIKADKAFKLKIEICELIITFEAGDYEALAYRLEQVKKSFGSLQKSPKFKNDFDIIMLLGDMAASGNYKRDETIQKRIKTLLAKERQKHDEEEIIAYEGWLIRKVRGA